MKKVIAIFSKKLFRQVIVSLAVIFGVAPCVVASLTYVTTGSGNVVKVDLNTGSTQVVASLPSSVSPDVRGIAYDGQGRIYVGTTWLSAPGWSNRVVRITPQTNGVPIIEPFTSPVAGTYGAGQIGFNSKWELFVAGDSVYRYDQGGQLLGTIGGNAYVSLLVDGDMLYSVAYFSPYSLLRYDTSGSQPVGGVIAQLQLPFDYCPTSLCTSHTGNLAIGFSSVNHAGWTELWEYNLQTQGLHKLFDCGGPSGFAQYDPFSNTYLIGGTGGLTMLDTQGHFVKSISNPDLGSVRLISETFIPEPATLLLLGFGAVMLRRKRWL